VRKIAILPTLLTLGNGVCGFAAIAYASKISLRPSEADNFYFVLSAGLIFVAMVFDGLDGYAARLSKSASDFGGQLDSLCDAISFGAAPALLLLRLGQEWQQPLIRQSVATIAGLYVACAVLRLARFNLENSTDPASHKRFKGLPSPAAAGCLASLALLRSLPAGWTGLDEPAVRAFVKFWTPVGAPMGALVVALLMVSRLPYPHLTKQLLRGRRSFGFIVQIVFVVFVITLAPDLALFLLFWGYALHGPVRYALVRRLRRDPGVDLGPTHSPSME
jgi:CDP-diacylglycerol--serine O-phosphatidyltransferase